MKQKIKKILILTLFLASPLATAAHFTEDEGKTVESFGHWSIPKALFDYILEVIPKGSTIVELGSGWTSGQLSKYYTVYSLENHPKWLYKYDTNYIAAPIIDRWYDVDIVRKNLPKNYSLILVDGPTGSIGREGFLKNIDLFNLENVLIILDDVHRKAEYNLFVALAKHLNRRTEIRGGAGKRFGILHVN